MAEVARNHSSLPFGYDEAFVNPVDEDFLCPICQMPAKEPIQTSCGHRFCEECINEYLQRNERPGQYCTCPVDRETVLHKENIFPDIATKRKILSLRIKCRNDGCPWTDELREKENHLKSCKFEVVRCNHENCQAMVISKDLELHRTRDCPWRVINCSYCQEPYAVCQEKDHYNHCKRFPTLCDCGAVVSREMIQDHTENYCPKVPIPCPYDEIGCKAKVPREKRELHLQSATGQHIKLVKEGLQEQVNDLKKKNEERREGLQNKVNTFERQLEKEVQMLKVELKNLDAAFEEKNTDIRKEFKNEMNALRRQHDEEVRVLKEEREREVDALQKDLAACKKKVDTLENVVNTSRNERAANEEGANNQIRELEERVAKIEKIFIFGGVGATGAAIIFAFVKFFARVVG